jgi:phenylpropionate dioxygenase-like ring-hydroxylating dioxygenase large terminal subunit
MLSAERNAFMTQVGPGTPMGELFRRFWLPISLPEQLAEPDGDPVRLRILGEDLVAFRDTNGSIGLVEAFCPHRRAPLFFGRNEECGLRCVYHGWKFDASGACIDMPSEPPESNFRDKVSIGAYPVRELGDTIWAYLGPPEEMPELPLMEWVTLPSEHRYVGMWIVESNWLQVLEGNVDTSHVSFLHSTNDGIPGVREEGWLDKAPRLMVVDSDIGFAYGGRRASKNDNYYWRVTQFMMPMYTLIPGPGWPRACVGVVPIDDHHTLRFQVSYNPEKPLQMERIPFTPRELSTFDLPGNMQIDTWVPTENRRNLYSLDRETQRKINYSGIAGIETQDRAMTEGMGYVCDRTREHLGTSDLAVIAARRLLERRARELQQGSPPVAAALHDRFGVRPLDAISPHANLGDLLNEHLHETRMTTLAS